MDDRDEALAEVTGALCYGLLRTFQATARVCSNAPTPALAERQAGFAADELQRFRVLRTRLNGLTPDPESALRAFRSTLDAFYDAAGSDQWLEAQVFHYVGDTITSDFAEFLSARADSETADALRSALTGRMEQEAFALEQIEAALAADPDAQDRIGRFARSLVGAALNRLRDALLESDALERVLGAGGVKDLVLELLGRHRERLERLGLDTLE